MNKIFTISISFFFLLAMQWPQVSKAQCSVDAGADKTICSGQTTTLTAITSGGTLPFTYLWSNASTNASITVGTAGTYTVTVTDAAITPCTASDQVVVNVNPLPAPVVSGLQCVCINSSGCCLFDPRQPGKWICMDCSRRDDQHRTGFTSNNG